MVSVQLVEERKALDIIKEVATGRNVENYPRNEYKSRPQDAHIDWCGVVNRSDSTPLPVHACR
jgi:hypothetical protein